MTNTKAAQVVNAARLRPFDQEDKDFFNEFGYRTIDEKLSQLHDNYIMFISQTVGIFESHFQKTDALQVSVVARTARSLLRDIKHCELALMNHLEQIEVSGEWK